MPEPSSLDLPCDLDIGWFGHVSINESRRHQADKLRHATRHEFSEARAIFLVQLAVPTTSEVAGIWPKIMR